MYLDIDDLYGTGTYDRLICVAYVNYDSTHYLNVNKALLVEGYAEISNYDNEFTPYTWTLYVHVNNIPEFSSFVLLFAFIVATISIVIFNRRKLPH